MKKLLISTLLISTTLFSAPPVPQKAPQGVATKFECVNSENYSYELIVKKGPTKSSPIFVVVDGEEIVIADPMMLAIFNSVISEESSGVYEGEKYYTIGVPPNISNCSKK